MPESVKSQLAVSRGAQLTRPHTFAPLSTIALGLILAFGSANASAQTLGAMNEENSEELWDSIDAEELDVEDDEVWETVEAGLSEELEAPTFDHCEGLLTHLDPIAVAPVSKPPRMSLYLEPGFNSRNRRITDSAQGQVSRPFTNSAPSWNLDESLIILPQYANKDARTKFNLLDGSTYQVLGSLDIPAVANDTLYWSQITPMSVVFLSESDSSSGRIVSFDIATGDTNSIQDLESVCKEAGYTSVGGIFSKPSADENLYGFQCATDTKSSIVISYDHSSGELNSMPVGEGTDWQLGHALQPSIDGENFWYQGTALSTDCTTLINGGTDLVLQPEGTQLYANPTEAKDWIAVSNIGYGNLKQFASKEAAQTFFSEVFLANTNPDRENQVCRLTHHRSFGKSAQNASYDTVLGEPSVSVSPTGTRVLFSSDWYDSGSVDTYVVELPTFTRIHLDGDWTDNDKPNMVTRIAQAGTKFTFRRSIIDAESLKESTVATGTGRITGKQIDLDYLTSVSNEEESGKCTALVQNSVLDIVFRCENDHFDGAGFNLVR